MQLAAGTRWLLDVRFGALSDQSCAFIIPKHFTLRQWVVSVSMAARRGQMGRWGLFSGVDPIAKPRCRLSVYEISTAFEFVISYILPCPHNCSDLL